MKKYLNALLYGNRETKQYLWSVLIGSLLTLGVGGFAIGRRNLTLGVIAVLAGIITLVIWQSRNLTDKELERNEKNSSPESGKKRWFDLRLRKKNRRGKDDVREEDEIEGKQKEEVQEKERRGRSGKKTADYGKYSENVLNQTLHHYRVKKGNKTVMIDSCVSRGIKECPAYLWKDRRCAYLLLLEDEPRRISFPLSEMTVMEYQGGVLARPTEEYQAFQKNSLVTSVFRPYLPTYYQVRKNGAILTRKNLYVMAGDLVFTNTSARNVMDILGPSFRVKDTVTSDERNGVYFIECYQQNILLRDGALDVQDYKDRIKTLLQNMAQEDMVFDDFRRGLERMVEYRLITDEFADYFMDYRLKWQEAQKRKK